MKLVLSGPKCSGKSKLGRDLAEQLSVPFYETDLMIEGLFKARTSSSLSCRAICAQHGEDYFRELERACVMNTSSLDHCVISTGGSTILQRDSRRVLRTNSLLILVTASIETLLERLSEKKIPHFLDNNYARDLFAEKASLVTEVISPFAEILIDSSSLSYEETYLLLLNELVSYADFLAARADNATARILRDIQSLPTKKKIEIIRQFI